MTFKEYFKVLLDGKPNEFIINYFNSNDMPYPDRYREFGKHLKELDNSGIELTVEMEDIIEEINDVESGYGNVEDI